MLSDKVIGETDQFTTALKQRNCYCLEVTEIETMKLKKNT